MSVLYSNTIIPPNGVCNIMGSTSLGTRPSATFTNTGTFNINNGARAFPALMAVSTTSQPNILGTVGTSASNTNLTWRTDLPGLQIPTNLSGFWYITSKVQGISATSGSPGSECFIVIQTQAAYKGVAAIANGNTDLTNTLAAGGYIQASAESCASVIANLAGGAVLSFPVYGQTSTNSGTVTLNAGNMTVTATYLGS
jgi:hypothetical protein